MKPFHTLCLSVLACLPMPAAADCAGEIAALFRGGPWDPFVRENRRETTIIVRPDGTQAPSTDVLWDGPLRSINCTVNGCFMGIGSNAWSGPGFQGPWTASGNTGVTDPEAFARATTERFAASVSEAECPGEVELGGGMAVFYRFFSKPQPNEYGSWWGGRYSVWVDPAAQRILRVELSEGIASWAPTPSPDVHVTTIVYDPSIRIEEPK